MSDHGGRLNSDVTSKLVAGSVDEVVERLLELVSSRGLTLFALVDHSGEAQRAGLQLRTTKLVIFGSPVAGTPVMQSVPLAALDPPLKILIWDDGGQTTVSYISPQALAARNGLSDELAQRLAGIEPLTDQLVAASS